MGKTDRLKERGKRMSGCRLCQIRLAKNPYYIESISTNIYSIEELCFYLQNNIYLIDQTLVNEKLCNWIRDELGLEGLYRRLSDQLERGGSIGDFILPIFKEISYLSHSEFRKMQEEISKIEIQPSDIRKKVKADYLVEYEMYMNAIQEYYQILKERNPGKLGVQFYASVLNNMAVAYAKMFLFEEAADCLWQSFQILQSKESYRRYLLLLPMYLGEEETKERLEELGEPQEKWEELKQEQKKIYEKAQDHALSERLKNLTPEEFFEECKETYHKSTSS